MGSNSNSHHLLTFNGEHIMWLTFSDRLRIVLQKLVTKVNFSGKGTPKTSWIPRDRLKYLRMNILSRLLSLFEFGLACFMNLFHQISNRTNFWDSKKNS
jgi:hypothetical protein